MNQQKRNKFLYTITLGRAEYQPSKVLATLATRHRHYRLSKLKVLAMNEV